MVKRSPSKIAVILMSILVLSVCTPLIVSAQDTEGEEPAQVEPMFSVQSEMDSLVFARGDSIATARKIADMTERKRLGWFYNLKHSGVGEKFDQGGNFMWGLLTASLIGLVFIIERFVTLFRARVDIRRLMGDIVKTLHSEGVGPAMKVCERTRGPIAAVLHSGLLRSARGPEAVKEAIETAGSIETSFLERGLVAIATVANVAPLLGFLGTVSGMISAFAAIAAAEQVSAKVVASGIEEALITTATGLIIAIPASIAHSFFVSQIDRFVLEMEESSAELVNELIELGAKQ